MKVNRIFILGLFSFLGLMAQERIRVTETTLPLSFEQTVEVFYSFAEGDEIVFNMNMLQGKHIKYVEIVELPSNIIFTEFKAQTIRDRRIKVRKKGIYLFRFYSSSLTNRVCKYRIDRIPANPSTRKFNTGWKWHTVRDTVYTPYQTDSLTGYQTIEVTKKKKVLVKTDTILIPLDSRRERIHSNTALNKSPYSYITIRLPENEYYPDINNPYRSVETFAWSHWLGVGVESEKAYHEANFNIKSGLNVLGELTGYGALAQLAISGISVFKKPEGQNVGYRFIGIVNGTEVVFHKGNGTSNASRHNQFTQGSFLIELYNDNLYKGINVDLEIVVARLSKIWEDKEYIEELNQPQYVTLNKTRMDINEHQIRVPVE